MYIYVFVDISSHFCTFNILAILYNGHIALNYTGYFVYNALNSYLIYIGYWTLNIYYYYN